MSTYSLVPYRLRVKKKQTSDNYYDLSEIPIDQTGNTKSFIEIFRDFADKYKRKIKKFEEREKTLTLQNPVEFEKSQNSPPTHG